MVSATTPLGGGDPKILRGGGFLAWPLPPDRTGARFARHLVRVVSGELGMPATTTYDATVALSELATNVHVHAYGGGDAANPPRVAGLPELWAYVRWRARPEIVFKVYDSAPWRGPVPYGLLRPPVDAEGGRGFEVVHALTAEHGGEWGVHRTRSRLGPESVSGVPAGWRSEGDRSSCGIRDVPAQALRGRRFARLVGGGCLWPTGRAGGPDGSGMMQRCLP